MLLYSSTVPAEFSSLKNGCLSRSSEDDYDDGEAKGQGMTAGVRCD